MKHFAIRTGWIWGYKLTKVVVVVVTPVVVEEEEEAATKMEDKFN